MENDHAYRCFGILKNRMVNLNTTKNAELLTVSENTNRMFVCSELRRSNSMVGVGKASV